MVYGDLQFIDILIFAGVAIFLIYRLRSVLGKRTGYQKKTTVINHSTKPLENEKKETPSLNDNETKLSLNLY